jgi:hypothetical protein
MSSCQDRGFVLLAVILVITVLAALGAMLGLATATEVAIAANHRDAAETRYAAEAGVEFVVQELANAADWPALVSAPGQSIFVDGAAAGERRVGPRTVDLGTVAADLDALAPLAGSASPRVLHAFGYLHDLVPIAEASGSVYVAVWVAQFLNDDGSMRVPATMSILGLAWGPRGSRRAVEVVVEQMDPAAVRRRFWREWP